MKHSRRILYGLSIALVLLMLSSTFSLAASPVELRKDSSVADILPSAAAAVAEAASASTPKEQFELARKAYYDPKFAGEGQYKDLWDPIPIQKYWDPINFYEPPKTVQIIATATDCINCHKSVTRGFYEAWKGSWHARLDEIRKVKPGSRLYYKKEKLEEIEGNLRSQGLLGGNESLKEVTCIDCHGGVGVKTVDHSKSLKMPDRASCGACHIREFIEAESEKMIKWPQGQWPDGRPSHALDYRANVETDIWAGMSQRGIAQGCDSCHYNQNKCDGCHTRHSFSTVEARKPEACAMCHNGVDHNEFENYQLSKHGTIYYTLGDKWDWEVPLKDAISKGGYTAPTCAFCHFEYKGEFTHNVVRKVRWAFNPTPAIADNLNHEWFKERQADWVNTCRNCHSGRFAETYLQTADKAILEGLAKEQEAKKVVQALYDEGLLTGQNTNRPAPPKPVKDGPAGFFQLFWSEGNNPSAVEQEYAEMWEHDIIKLYKGATHMNPGGYTYSQGWVPLLSRYSKIMDENTKLREWAELKKKVAQVDNGMKTAKRVVTGGSGLGLLLIGGLAIYRAIRKD